MMLSNQLPKCELLGIHRTASRLIGERILGLLADSGDREGGLLAMLRRINMLDHPEVAHIA